MQLPDVNVLVYAHRSDVDDHIQYLDWLSSLINSNLAFGMSELVLSGFLRIVTHPRIFKTPSKLSDARRFVDQIKSQPNCIIVSPGPRHWSIFDSLIRTTADKGNLIPDAYHAALAIEFGCEWITSDRDFSRFKNLKWRHPLHN